MGLHINEKLLSNNNYKKSVQNDIKRLEAYFNDLIQNYDPYRIQEIYDLLRGQDFVDITQGSKGLDTKLSFTALKFDKIGKDEFRADKREIDEDDDDFGNNDDDEYLEEENKVNPIAQNIMGYLYELNQQINEIKGKVGMESVDKDKAYLFPSIDIAGVSSKYQDDFIKIEEKDFTKEEIEGTKNEIENNKFGFYATSDLYAKSKKVTLSDRILRHLEARKPEDWLDCMQSKEAIDSYLKTYELSQGNVHFNDARYAMGRLISESMKGKDIDENNIKPILNDMKAKNDKYKSVGWFRRAWSYVNPFKDSVRNLRNEINDARKILEYKELDMDQLDAFLDGKANINSVAVPEDAPYSVALHDANITIARINASIQTSVIQDKHKLLKVDGIQLNDMVNHEEKTDYDLEESAKEIKQLIAEVKGEETEAEREAEVKLPIDAEVEKSMNDIDGPAQTEKFQEETFEQEKKVERE